MGIYMSLPIGPPEWEDDSERPKVGEGEDENPPPPPAETDEEECRKFFGGKRIRNVRGSIIRHITTKTEYIREYLSRAGGPTFTLSEREVSTSTGSWSYGNPGGSEWTQLMRTVRKWCNRLWTEGQECEGSCANELGECVFRCDARTIVFRSAVSETTTSKKGVTDVVTLRRFGAWSLKKELITAFDKTTQTWEFTASIVLGAGCRCENGKPFVNRPTTIWEEKENAGVGGESPTKPLGSN